MLGHIEAIRTHPRVVIGMVAALVATSGVIVLAQNDDSDKVTVVRAPVNARVVTASGDAHPARDGEPLEVGSRLVTAAAGSARLEAASRALVLGPSTALRRTQQSLYDLSAGSVVIDRRKGPGVSLRAGDVTVDQVARGAYRVDRGYDVRVGAFAGSAHVQSETRQDVQVAAFQQVTVVGTAVPSAPSPLVLTTGDQRERAVAPTLVGVDEYLSRVARGLDARTSAVTLPAAYRVSAPDRLPASEQALPFAIAAAGKGGTLVERYRRARTGRELGGSWGPVAGLSGALGLTSLEAAVADLVEGKTPVQTPVDAGSEPTLPGAGLPSGVPTTGGPTSGRPSTTPPRTTTPPPTQDTVDELVTTVQDLLSAAPTIPALPLGALLGARPTSTPRP